MAVYAKQPTHLKNIECDNELLPYLSSQRNRYLSNTIREAVVVAFNIRNQSLESLVHTDSFLRGREELSEA